MIPFSDHSRVAAMTTIIIFLPNGEQVITAVVIAAAEKTLVLPNVILQKALP